MAGKIEMRKRMAHARAVRLERLAERNAERARTSAAQVLAEDLQRRAEDLEGRARALRAAAEALLVGGGHEGPV